jgi:hypothetical protein
MPAKELMRLVPGASHPAIMFVLIRWEDWVENGVLEWRDEDGVLMRQRLIRLVDALTALQTDGSMLRVICFDGWLASKSQFWEAELEEEMERRQLPSLCRASEFEKLYAVAQREDHPSANWHFHTAFSADYASALGTWLARMVLAAFAPIRNGIVANRLTYRNDSLLDRFLTRATAGRKIAITSAESAAEALLAFRSAAGQFGVLPERCIFIDPEAERRAAVLREEADVVAVDDSLETLRHVWCLDPVGDASGQEPVLRPLPAAQYMRIAADFRRTGAIVHAMEQDWIRGGESG